MALLLNRGRNMPDDCGVFFTVISEGPRAPLGREGNGRLALRPASGGVAAALIAPFISTQDMTEDRPRGIRVLEIDARIGALSGASQEYLDPGDGYARYGLGSAERNLDPASICGGSSSN